MSRPSVNFRPLALAHLAVAQAVSAGDHVVDATVGNGHDTEFLAGLVGERGLVTGFDIQESALDTARRRLTSAGLMDGRITLICGSHAGMEKQVHQQVSAIMFNLGYLPGSDKSVVTCAEETLPALSQACVLLKKGGILTVMCYPGHEGGREECQRVENFMADLPLGEWSVTKAASLNGAPDSPFLLVAVRKS